MKLLILLQANGGQKVTTGLNNLYTWGFNIATALIGLGVLYCIVKAAFSFFNGESQKGWALVMSAIIGVVLFALIPTIKTEIPNLFK